MRKRKKDEKEISHERYSVDGGSVPFEKVWKLDTPDRLADARRVASPHSYEM